MTDTDHRDTGPDIDWRAARRAQRKARRAARRAHSGEIEHGGNGGAIGGAILVAIGAVLLAGQFGYELPERWWAALLLIPAVGSLVAAIRQFRADDRVSHRVLGSLVAGIVFLALAGAVYFGLDWSVLWPALLIIVGLGIISRNAWR
jgi:hypothetical protein